MVKTKKYLGIFSFLISEIIGLLITTGYFFADDYNRSLFWENFIKGLRCYQEVIPIGLFVGIFLVYPFVLTLLNLYFLFAPMKDELHNRKGRQTEYITVIWGTFCSAAFHLFLEIQYNADWTETLVNEQVHTPIYTQAQSTVYLLVILGIVGYLVLSAFKVTKLPPLVTVLCIAAMYLGIVECIFWIVQVFGWGEDSSMLCLLPLTVL